MAKVLFISNDEKKISVVCAVLRANAIEVDVISSENDVFDKIADFYPDLILLDTTLPDTDITILAKKIKINTQTDNIELLVHKDYRWSECSKLNTLDWAPADKPIIDKLMEG